MIQIDTCEVKEASRIYGDFAEKVAFEFDVNGANVLGSLVGGFAGTKTFHHVNQKNQQKELEALKNERTLENNHYDNIQNILRDLKIVFTPINVVFSVNGQVFEIIKSNEMSPEMKERFLAKDGDYFKTLLVNKMNMELQLAEQIFARRLLQPHLPESYKEAYFVSPLLEKLSETDYELATSEKLEKTASSNTFKLSLSFDSLRPFSRSDDFFRPNNIEKVANLITPYGPSIVEMVSAKDLKGGVHVSFLPDRVVFLLDGNLIEQMTVMQMNEDGFDAFKKRDEDFFLNFFHEEAKKISESIFQDVMAAQADPFGKQASDEEDENTDEVIFNDEEEVDSDEDDKIDKEAATLEEVMASVDKAWIEELAVNREDMDLFKDADIHPLVYDFLLDRKIHDNWHELELEAVLKEIEITFDLTEPISDRALDKIATLHTIQNEEHSMFATSFSFEKFLRAMNSKSVLITTYEGGLEFEEILFALDIAKAVCGESVFLEFGKNVVPYVAEELYRDSIRFVSDQVYDETNEFENDFWIDVNDMLARKWKERDSHGLEDLELETAKNRTDSIMLIGETVLTTYAEFLEFARPYESAREILQRQRLTQDIENEEGVVQAVTQTVGRHLICSLFLEVKRQEAISTSERLTGSEVE